MSDTVLVTGANSGLGLAIALEAARAGYDVVGTVRSEAKAEVVDRAASEAGVRVRTALLDVTDADGCARVVAATRPWALVNNAGYGHTGAIEDVGDDEARQLLETMVVAPMRLARLSLPHMRERGGGRIVNISSVLGLVTAPYTGWYQASKHALEALSDALRLEVADAGIAVVLVEPGGFRTNIWEDLQADIARREGSPHAPGYRRLATLTRLAEPLMGDPRRVAGVVVGALRARRPRARYVVGVDARAAALAAQVTPTPVRDTVTRLALGLLRR